MKRFECLVGFRHTVKSAGLGRKMRVRPRLKFEGADKKFQPAHDSSRWCCEMICNKNVQAILQAWLEFHIFVITSFMLQHRKQP